MEREKINPEVLENFYYRSKEEVLKKIHFLTNAASHLHLVLDFDRTLTVGRNNYGENISTWEFLRKYLCSEAQQKYQHLYNIYRPREVQGNMTLSEAVCWWESTLRLYQDEGLKWSDIGKDMHERMPIRPFVKEFFQLCQQKNIPTIIISAGLKDVIELWCGKHEIYPTKVISTKLTFSPDGHINGWEKTSLIHVLNKCEMGHEEIIKLRVNFPNIILVGDSINDASMAEGENNILRILINDPREDDQNTEIFKVPPQFDLVTRNSTFSEVLRLIDTLIE